MHMGQSGLPKGRTDGQKEVRLASGPELNAWLSLNEKSGPFSLLKKNGQK